MSEADDRNSRTVYINNLSYQRDELGVKKLFTPFGAVNSAHIIIDIETGLSKGMAFVEMKSVEAAITAIAELNGTIVDGRTVKVRKATPKDVKPKKFYPAPTQKLEEKKVAKLPPKKILKKPTAKVKRNKKKTELEIMLERVKKA